MQSPQDKPQLPKKNVKKQKTKKEFEIKLKPQLERKFIPETEVVL